MSCANRLNTKKRNQDELFSRFIYRWNKDADEVLQDCFKTIELIK